MVALMIFLCYWNRCTNFLIKLYGIEQIMMKPFYLFLLCSSK